MDNKKEMRDLIRDSAVREIVMKYLFIKTIEDTHGDEYIKTMYRINSSLIRQAYNALGKEEREEMEKIVKEQIELGEVDLNKEAINWHRQSVKKEVIGEKNNEKSIRREEH